VADTVTATRVAPSPPDDREKIGLCFADFCRQAPSEFSREVFKASLKRHVPEASLSDRPVFQPTNDAAIYFLDQPDASARRAWRVNSRGVDFLLPHPVPGTQARFETTDGFEVDTSSPCSPPTLEDCLPAVLKRNGNQWEIDSNGRLSAQPDLRLKAWWDEMTKPPPPPAPPPPSELLTAEALAAAFVHFCHEAAKSGPADRGAFEHYLRQRHGTDGIANAELALPEGGFARGWLVHSGTADGWLIPALESGQAFLSSSGYFTFEGQPTPGTIRTLVPARVTWEGSGEELKWSIKESGRVSADADPTGPAEETRHIVGRTFVEMCREIAELSIGSARSLAGSVRFKQALTRAGYRPQQMGIYGLSLSQRGAGGLGALLSDAQRPSNFWLVRVDAQDNSSLWVTPQLPDQDLRGADEPDVFAVAPTGQKTIGLDRLLKLTPARVEQVHGTNDYRVVDRGTITLRS